MIASLPMYDRPSTAASNDRLWALIRDGLRARGGAAPERLTRDGRALDQHWQNPALVLSQTCGYPYRAKLHSRVTLVGTPDYRVAGCPPGHYCSRIVVRADEPRERLDAFRGARLAYNSAQSQSGWAALANFAPALAAGPLRETGGHAGSALAVAEGDADLAALDAVTWDILLRDEPFATGLRVLASTPPTPGLPLIAAAGADAETAFAAVADAIAALAPGDRDCLRLYGIVRIDTADYLAVPTPPEPGQLPG